MLKRLAIDYNNSIRFAVHKSNNLNCDLVSEIGNFMRSTSCSKKQKIFHEGRMFELFVKYFVVHQNERALCLISQNNIACLKEVNIKRNYSSRHSEQYEGIWVSCEWIKPISWRCHCRSNRKWFPFTKSILTLDWIELESLVKEQQRKEKPSATAK